MPSRIPNPAAVSRRYNDRRPGAHGPQPRLPPSFPRGRECGGSCFDLHSIEGQSLPLDDQRYARFAPASRPSQSRVRGLRSPAFAGMMFDQPRAAGAWGLTSLDFDGGAGSFAILLARLGFFLRHGFLQDAAGLGEVLGFLQAQAGDGANGLDDLDLLVAGRLQGDGE